PEVKLVVEGDGRSYTARAPGVSRSQASELRGGKVRAEETIDLHGMTVEVALGRLREFVASAVQLRRCVLIVHGRGLHSEHGAPRGGGGPPALRAPPAGRGPAGAPAAPADGGEGATYLVLRGPR